MPGFFGPPAAIVFFVNEKCICYGGDLTLHVATEYFDDVFSGIAPQRRSLGEMSVRCESARRRLGCWQARVLSGFANRRNSTAGLIDGAREAL
ncbi:MAG: hypothetical protein J0G28_16010 [Afipia sp.]|nr:hypothetical protein [Afipia sp.]OJW65202.1 MAG: hypothetical protein BGO65_14410 [Afipia sp. 64-13]